MNIEKQQIEEYDIVTLIGVTVDGEPPLGIVIDIGNVAEVRWKTQHMRNLFGSRQCKKDLSVVTRPVEFEE